MIVRLDPAAGADLDGWSGLVAACFAADQPEQPEPSRGQLLARLESTSDERVEAWLARDGDRVVGAVRLVLFSGRNAHLAHVGPQVHPQARRRGTGRLLLATALDAARAAGRSTVVADTRDDGPAGAFARAHGFRPVQHEVNSVLPLAELDTAAMATWAAGAEAKTAGFELVRWAGAVPEHLMAPFLLAMTGMDDTPRGELEVRADQPEPAQVRQTEESYRRQGVRLYAVAPYEPATGALAGYTSMHVHPDEPWALVGTTTVLPAYRGRGFGLWMKAAMIEWLAEAEPRLTGHLTGNAAENAHMRRINERLGYRVSASWQVWQREL